MVYVGILAGGLGTRMHRMDMPKQFLMLGSKPIIIHTLEQFIINQSVDRIIIAAPSEWKLYTMDLLEKWLSYKIEIDVICGGVNKNKSIKNIVDFIDNKWGIGDQDIIVNHDAIRPFVNQRIIDDNIELCKKYGAVNTVMPTVDTIVESKDKAKITSIPPKRFMYFEQTPQTFNLYKLKSAFEAADKKLIDAETDTARLLLNNGINVCLAMGEYSNMKIITPYDLEVANALIKGVYNDK